LAVVAVPATEGVKETRTEHNLPGCREVGTWRVSDVIEKSPGFAPVIASVFKLCA
jgi:hypothetical protein